MSWRDLPKKQYQPRDPSTTSAMMAAVKSKDGKAELILRHALHARGHRYRLHVRRLMGKPDIVFAAKRLLVFVDGDFWHGRALIEEGVEGLRRGIRTQRSEWWIEKINKTVERDRKVSLALTGEGWRVLRFWESEVLADLQSVVCKIESLLG
jgi:DNA mismatch endonuclease (patch repair protein)